MTYISKRDRNIFQASTKQSLEKSVLKDDIDS